MLWYASSAFVRAGFTIQHDAVRCAISFSRVKRLPNCSAYCSISRRSDASCCVYGRVGAQLLKNGHKNLRKTNLSQTERCMKSGHGHHRKKRREHDARGRQLVIAAVEIGDVGRVRGGGDAQHNVMITPSSSPSDSTFRSRKYAHTGSTTSLIGIHRIEPAVGKDVFAAASVPVRFR